MSGNILKSTANTGYLDANAFENISFNNTSDSLYCVNSPITARTIATYTPRNKFLG
ncbi:MAG: hypothetical protein DSM106950_14680 [Stigonema ocellatum SAG 48.90 = DSM 106950]|nr:hypothetical protein [Stigonema ocellatum SAG 48.90 = DSM 106950]